MRPDPIVTDIRNGALPFQYVRPQKHSRLRAFLISALGWIACWYAFWGLGMTVVLGANILLLWPILTLLGHLNFSMTPFLVALMVALPGLVFALFGPELVERGRQMRVADAIDTLTHDTRAPVVYLRSFDDEHLADLTFPSIFTFRPLWLRTRYELGLTRGIGKDRSGNLHRTPQRAVPRARCRPHIRV